ncbi:Enoyl-CoA isomerase [Phaffia rhodozyma]|uniref:Enoyl-CoA isomerase n=1 Tax=Phaffia rhodozyma TaxID=264483 RepID=A0A0F7SRA1_PHARH|nr:Enoyl-CoA isomerase [Phaffia rhodozyma]
MPSYIVSSNPSPHVLLLSLSRNPVNAFSEEYWQELGRVFDKVNSMDDIRCVVLASNVSKGFSAGLDLVAPENVSLGGTKGLKDPARASIPLRHHVLDFQECITKISKSRVPVIASIHGVCVGLGIDIASACDIRLAAADTTFAIREVAIAMAADIGSLQRVPKITGNDSLVRELALTGRFFKPEVALQLGLISRIIPGSQKEVLEKALELAEQIAENSPIAVLGTKHLLDHGREHSIQEGLEYTALWNSVMGQTQDLTEAIATFSKRGKGKPNNVGFANLSGKRGESKL